MPLCMKSEIQIGLTGAKNMQERRHGNVPKNFLKFVELTKVLLSDQNLDLVQPLDQVSRDRDMKFIVGSGASMHMVSKVDLSPEEQEEQETITVSNKPANSHDDSWDDRYERAGDRLREGSAHVRYCPISQGFSSRSISWKNSIRLN